MFARKCAFVSPLIHTHDTVMVYDKANNSHREANSGNPSHYHMNMRYSKGRLEADMLREVATIQNLVASTRQADRPTAHHLHEYHQSVGCSVPPQSADLLTREQSIYRLRHCRAWHTTSAQKDTPNHKPHRYHNSARRGKENLRSDTFSESMRLRDDAMRGPQSRIVASVLASNENIFSFVLHPRIPVPILPLVGVIFACGGNLNRTPATITRLTGLFVARVLTIFSV